MPRTTTRGRRLLSATLCLAGLIFTAPPRAGAQVINPDDGSPRLPSGHCLIADSSNTLADLWSPAKRINLVLYRTGQLSMDNDLYYGNFGYSDIWGYTPRTPGTAASLCMQRNGDLVLRRNGIVEWHSRSTAVGGHAVLLDSGRLVVVSTTGHIVWLSRSTNVLMIAGDVLRSGQYMANYTYPGVTSRLEMRTSGDLVLLRNSTQVWHSNTHVPESYLWVTNTGRLAISTPAHKPIWNTPAYAHAVARLAQQGRLVLESGNTSQCWQRPGGSGPLYRCDAG